MERDELLRTVLDRTEIDEDAAGVASRAVLATLGEGSARTRPATSRLNFQAA